jgi:hypothetical protein
LRRPARQRHATSVEKPGSTKNLSEPHFFFSANEILPNAQEICTGAARISKKCGSDEKVNPVEGVAVGDDEIIENIMKSTKIKH